MSLVQDLVVSRRPAVCFAQIGIFWGAFAAQVPPLKEQAALSDSAFGLAMLVSAFGAVMAMTVAPSVDRVLNVRALPLLSTVMAGLALLPGLAGSWVTFAGAMLLATVCVATLDVLMNARVTQIEAREGRALMNLNHAVFSFAYAGGALFAGLMREAGVAPFPVFAIVALGVVLMVPMTRGVELGTQSDAHPDVDSRSKLPMWTIVPAGLIVLLAFMSENATEAWSALHLERNMGAGAATGALGPTILGLTMGFGRLSGQIVSQRWSEAQVIWWASVTTALGAGLAGWANTLVLGYLGFALLGIGVSVVAPLAFAWVGRIMPSDLRTLAISRVAVIGYSGFFVGPPLMGFLSEGYGLHVSFSAIAALMLVVPLILVPILLRRNAQ